MKVKISGDGAKMARNSNFTIISFNLLHEPEVVYLFCIIKAPESYEMLASCCREVFQYINDLMVKKCIEIDERSVPLNIYLGADYKFLLIIMGLSGATSIHACLWCDVTKDERHDMTKDENYYNTAT